MASKRGLATLKRRLSAGFTLVEVLIVVVIMAILAGTIISRFLDTTDDAKTSTLEHNMSVVQVQIELYRTQHLHQYPTIQDHALPQLISATNAAGEIGTAGTTHPLGPYLVEAPTNPFDGSKNVSAVSKAGEKPAGVADSSGGWQYDVTNGRFWPNNPEYYK